MRKYLPVLVLFVAAFTIGIVGFQAYRDNQLASGEESAYGGAFKLVDMNGKEITEQSLRGHPSAVFFGYTHCPVICPTTLFDLDSWLKQLGPEGADIRGYMVTIDPERDTPEYIEKYITNVSNRITGITGDPKDIAAMLKSYNIYAKKVDEDGDNYTMDHTASILLLDKNGRLRSTIAYGEPSETAISKLKRLAAG